MGFEEDIEKGKSSKPKSKTNILSFKDAIRMGEYNPQFLATYPEWQQFSPHVQFQYIRQALENRRKQLLMQWAEVNNMLDFRMKPQLADTLKNIEKQLKQVEKDRENIYFEFSKLI